MGAVMRIRMKGGVEVDMLFTPRLYQFKGTQGVTFEFESGNQPSLHAMYADVMFCAALNHWTLTHRVDEECPYQRMDFHEFSVMEQGTFAKVVLFAMQVLTGKSLKELEEEAKAKIDEEGEEKPEDVKKKRRSSWITRLLRRS